MIWAVVRFVFEGFHKWKEAPEEVSFLREKHRHNFTCEVWLEQKHNERDVEFILFKRALQGFVPHPYDMGEDSCETMAGKIKLWVKANYPHRKIKVSVFEDGENGAVVE